MIPTRGHWRRPGSLSPRSAARDVVPGGSGGLWSGGNRGFTLIEVLLTVTLLAILLTLFVPVSLQFQGNALLTSETALLAGDLRRAQASAVAGVNDGGSGVHIEPTPTDQWVLFRGGAYTPGAPENDVHVAPSAVDITAVTLAGGGQDVLFAERRGTTGNSGVVTLRAPNGQIRTISVNARGVVEIN